MEERIRRRRPRRRRIPLPLLCLIGLLAVIFVVGLIARGGHFDGKAKETFPDPEMNPYKESQFFRDGEFVFCKGVRTTTGVDVSIHQGDIDWEAVKEAGVDFAIIRVGYRGYDQGGLYLDDNFQKNMDGAIAAGLDVGVYFYSQATTPMEAKAEAGMVLAAIDGYTLTYPVVYDWEYIPDARTSGMTSQEVTDCAKAFCEVIESEFLQPAVYFNQALAQTTFRLPELQEYDFWLAQYNDAMTFAYDVEMWQYTCQGTVPGISTNVDIDLCFKPYGKVSP